MKATRGCKLRVDTTAVEMVIHFPTDSGLVGNGVRVVSRTVRRSQAVLGGAAAGLKETFRSRIQSAWWLTPWLQRIARRQDAMGRLAM